MNKDYFTDDEIDTITTTLTLTIKSSELYERQGNQMDFATREVIGKCKDLLSKLENDFY